jgi:hypothetical protein
MTMSVSPRLVLSLVAVIPCTLRGQSTGRQQTQLSAVPVVAPAAVEFTATPSSTVSLTPAPAAIISTDAAPVQPGAWAPEASVGIASATSEAAAVGPSLSAASAGIHARTVEQQRTARDAAQLAAHHGSGFGTDGALMIVGGAAFIAGLIIGGGAGTAVAIAGAAVGLYGLYLYLQS